MRLLLFTPALLLGLACGSGGSTPTAPAGAIEAGDAWALPHAPVVKLVETAPGELGVLAERHDHSEYDGRSGYVLDHTRTVRVVRKGRATPAELPAAREGELITDIAAGPEPGSLWVLAVRWNEERQELEPRLALHTGAEGKVEQASFALEPARFTELDAEAPPMGSVGRYTPRVDTMDVLRLAARGPSVGIIGRNASGTAYADRYEYAAGVLTRARRVALTPPVRRMRVGMTGGTYDVFGQLGNGHRVHAAMSADGTLVGAVVARSVEIGKVDALLGSNLFEALGVDALSGLQYAIVFRIPREGEVRPAGALLGDWADSLLLTLTAAGGRILAGGLSREGGDGRSVMVLLEVGGQRRILDPARASSAAQALFVDREGRLLIGGSWAWSQNPEGVSIAGGERFLAVAPDDGAAWTSSNLLAPGLRRSEARTLVSPAPGVVCVGGMDDGPDTHAADADLSQLDADGFVSCLAEP